MAVDEQDRFLDLAMRLPEVTAAEVGELTVATGGGWSPCAGAGNF